VRRDGALGVTENLKDAGRIRTCDRRIRSGSLSGGFDAGYTLSRPALAF
jgi:hypothetical protein